MAEPIDMDRIERERLAIVTKGLETALAGEDPMLAVLFLMLRNIDGRLDRLEALVKKQTGQGP